MFRNISKSVFEDVFGDGGTDRLSKVYYTCLLGDIDLLVLCSCV